MLNWLNARDVRFSENGVCLNPMTYIFIRLIIPKPIPLSDRPRLVIFDDILQLLEPLMALQCKRERESKKNMYMTSPVWIWLNMDNPRNWSHAMMLNDRLLTTVWQYIGKGRAASSSGHDATTSWPEPRLRPNAQDAISSRRGPVASKIAMLLINCEQHFWRSWFQLLARPPIY